jgi:hypothetical protein
MASASDGREVPGLQLGRELLAARRVDALADHAEGLVEADDRGLRSAIRRWCGSWRSVRLRGRGCWPGAGVGPGGGLSRYHRAGRRGTCSMPKGGSRPCGREPSTTSSGVVGQEELGHVHRALLEHLERRAHAAGDGELDEGLELGGAGDADVDGRRMPSAASRSAQRSRGPRRSRTAWRARARAPCAPPRPASSAAPPSPCGPSRRGRCRGCPPGGLQGGVA